jgi:hypothetical protein
LAEMRTTAWQRAYTIIGVVGSLCSVLPFLPIPSLQAAFNSVIELSSAVWFLIAFATLVVSLGFVRKGLAKHSRLKAGHVEVFRLEASKPEHLKGRKDDIERLAETCNNANLIFLTGESGAGKSSLLQAGLSPTLRAGGRVLPIYLDAWGQDWDDGPRAAMRFAIWETLSTDDRKALGLTELPALADISETLRAIEPKLQRTPFLLLDQFDDYQTLHREKFLPTKTKTWLLPKRLAEKNSFWGDVRQLIENRAIKCLIATRNDAAGGLRSVEFVPYESYQLDRLHSFVVGPLLDQLAKNDGDAGSLLIENPNYGWDQLKRRLADDLDRIRGVLPIQMRLAFRGLESLRTLTEREYDKEGGLTGLEAAYIERQIKNTAANTWGSDRPSPGERGVLALLVALVNRKDNEALKTNPKTYEELEKALLAENAESVELVEKFLSRVLDDLKKKEFLRSRTDPDTRGCVWLLDHDYLCRGVLEAERRADVWPTLLKRKAAAYKNAGRDAWARGQSQLKPNEQARLAWERFRGRLRYGKDGGFAIRCLARSLVPYVFIGLVLAVVSFGVRRESREARDGLTAHQIWSNITLMPEPVNLLVAETPRDDPYHAKISPSDAVAPFWKLALSTNEIRFRVLDLVFQSRGDLNRLEKEIGWLNGIRRYAAEREAKAAFVFQAIVGVDKASRDRVIKRARESYMRDELLASYPATFEIINEFVASTAMITEKDLYRDLLIGWISNMNLADRRRLSVITDGLHESTFDRVSPIEARAVIDKIIASLENYTSTFHEEVAKTKAALKKSGTFLSESGAMDAAEYFMKGDEVDPLLRSLATFQTKLATNDYDTVDHIRKLTEYINKLASKYPDAMTQVAQIPRMHLPSDPSPEQVFSLLFSDRDENGRTCYQALALIPDAIEHYPGKLPSAEAIRVVERIVALWGDGDVRRWNSGNNTELGINMHAFNGALIAASKSLASQDSFRAADLLFAVVEKTKDVHALIAIASVLNAIPGLVAASQQRIYAVLLAAMEKADDPSALAGLSAAVEGVPGRPSAAAQQRMFELLVAAMEKADNPSALVTLSAAVKNVPGRPSPAFQQRVFELLLASLAKVDNIQALKELSRAFKEFPGRLPAAETRRALSLISAALDTSFDWRESDALAQTLENLPAVFDIPALVELAKHPMCIGEFRAAVVKQMEKHSAPVTFQGNVWKMVDWLEEHEPSVDLKSPPKRP